MGRGAARVGLCSLLLCTALAHAAAAIAPEPAKSGTELENAIEANVEAQDYQEETQPVSAQIIKAEPAALIASGTGDISTTGAREQGAHHGRSMLVPVRASPLLGT